MLLIFNASYSQNTQIKRTNHWYFGEKAGLDFSNNSPVADTNSEMMVAGNAVTMSDTAGNLLFYSNRYNVWNRNHQIMPNGTGLTHWGTDSFSHALCVPQPENDSLYYIFYWEYDSTGFDLNMEYAIVNMSLDGGLGDVVSKRNFLMNKPLEGPGAVMHANGQDIWIVTMKFNTNSFHSFLLTNAGIDSTAVISNAGIVSDIMDNLQFSPDGKKLATTFTLKGYEICNFDNATGIVSNPIAFPACYCESYGVSFSPDGKKVYFSVHYFDIVPKGGHAIYQVSILADSLSTFNSKTLIDTMSVNDTINFNTKIGMPFGFQLASDGKIYVTRNALPTLGAISNPNAGGLNCNYSDSVIALQGRNAAYGFPYYMGSWFYDSSLVTTTSEIHSTDAQLISYPNPFKESATVILPFTGNTVIELYDVFGKKCELKKTIHQQNDKTLLTIQRNNLATGIYLLNIRYNTKSYSQKLVIIN